MRGLNLIVLRPPDQLDHGPIRHTHLVDEIDQLMELYCEIPFAYLRAAPGNVAPQVQMPNTDRFEVICRNAGLSDAAINPMVW
jgi:hypothetical protein